MRIHVKTKNGHCQLQIKGDMNIYNAPELKRQLLDHLGSAAGLDVDLSQVDEIDTAGFQVLYLTKCEAAKSGKTLHLTARSPAVVEIMELYNTATYFGDSVTVSSRQKKARARRHNLKANKTP